MRLDLWLWRARLFKTRTAAAARILEGAVRTGPASGLPAQPFSPRPAKPASLVRIGDAITLAGPQGVLSVQILALPTRRGPPAEGKACYAQFADDARATLDGGASQPPSSTSFDHPSIFEQS